MIKCFALAVTQGSRQAIRKEWRTQGLTVRRTGSRFEVRSISGARTTQEFDRKIRIEAARSYG